MSANDDSRSVIDDYKVMPQIVVSLVQSSCVYSTGHWCYCHKDFLSLSISRCQGQDSKPQSLDTESTV
jgi:hypothetical protein